jgi:methyl-accepting chemotaxis protein
MDIQFFRTSKHAYRIPAFLLVGISFCLVIMLIVFYQWHKSILQDEILTRLTTIANSQNENITTFVKEKTNNVTSLAKMPFVLDALEAYNTGFEKGVDSSAYKTADQQYSVNFDQYKKQYEFHDLFLISKDADIVFTVVKEDDFADNLRANTNKNSELANVFENATNTFETVISKFQYYTPSQKPALFIGAPIVKSGEFIGVVAIQIEDVVLYDLSMSFIGLGETGEVVLGAKNDSRVDFVAPLRHDANVTFQRKLELGSPNALPIQNAVQGTKGSGISIDYRGEEIIAVWRYLPSLKWGMVVKIDTDEVFAPLYKLKILTGLFSTLMLAGIVFALMLITPAGSAPIAQLIHNIKEITKGNLDISHENVDRVDEIGNLFKVFNQMVKKLKKDQKEYLVQSKKYQLENRLKVGQTDLYKVMRGEQDIKTLSQKVMDYLAEFMKIQVGEIYLLESQFLIRVAGYALKTEKSRPYKLKIGEGLIGQVALEKKSLLFNQLPDGHFSLAINTGIGKIKPQSVLGWPLLQNKRLVGVLVLGKTTEFSDDDLSMLEQVAESIAITIHSAQTHLQMKQLLNKENQ